MENAICTKMFINTFFITANKTKQNLKQLKCLTNREMVVNYGPSTL